MIIVYLVLAILAGISAATVALVSGAGLLIAFLAYVLAAITAIILCVLWMLLPRVGPAPQPRSAIRRS